jgi:alpha-beta hydrolase superfamily lysophospholipase
LPSSGFNKKWDATPNKTGYEWLSRDPEVGRAFLNDPKNFEESALQVFGVPNTLQLLGVPSKNIDNHVPILLIAGSEDPLGGERGNKLLLNAYRRAGVKDIEAIIYHDGRHEMVNETNKDVVLSDILAWINDRL